MINRETVSRQARRMLHSGVEARRLRMENESHRSAHLLHSQQMKDMKKDVGTYMELEDAVTAIVEKDRLIAQLREHLREEAELKDEDDGTRSPRRNVFQRGNESREEDLAHMRTLLIESASNLEATRRERDARLPATPVTIQHEMVFNYAQASFKVHEPKPMGHMPRQGQNDVRLKPVVAPQPKAAAAEGKGQQKKNREAKKRPEVAFEEGANINVCVGELLNHYGATEQIR